MATTSQKNKTAKAAEKPETDEIPAIGFPDLKWDRRESPRPTNRQRAVLAIAFALLLSWWVALGWLVFDSLS